MDRRIGEIWRLVFFLVGLLVNKLLIDIDLRDIINLGVLVAAALGARALALCGTLPLMSQFAKDLVSAGITRLLLARVDNLLYALKSTDVCGYQLAVQKALQFGPAFRIAVALYTRCLAPAPCTADRQSHRAVDRNTRYRN